MGTYYETVVDRDALTTEEAQRLARSVLDWLIAEEVIMAETDDCLLSDSPGHRPGPRYMAALENPADRQFLTLRTNGVEVRTTREVTLNNQGQFAGVICPACAQITPQNSLWSDASTDWHGGGTGELVCSHCAHRESVTQWEHIDPMGFGTLCFIFWNWPALSAAFVAALSQRLAHRIIVISGTV